MPVMPIPIIAYELTLIINIHTRNHQDKPKNDHWLNFLPTCPCFLQISQIHNMVIFLGLESHGFPSVQQKSHGFPYRDRTLWKLGSPTRFHTNMLPAMHPQLASKRARANKSFAHSHFGLPKHHEVRWCFWTPQTNIPIRHTDVQLRRYSPQKVEILSPRWIQKTGTQIHEWLVYLCVIPSSKYPMAISSKMYEFVDCSCCQQQQQQPTNRNHQTTSNIQQTITNKQQTTKIKKTNNIQLTTSNRQQTTNNNVSKKNSSQSNEQNSTWWGGMRKE